MLKAWKRQFGADIGVEIDIEHQIAVLRFPTPRSIDLEGLEASTRSGGHTVVETHLDVIGRRVVAPCSTCKEERPFVELEGTEERFEIEDVAGEAPPTGTTRFRGTLSTDWAGHLKLYLEPFGSD